MYFVVKACRVGAELAFCFCLQMRIKVTPPAPYQQVFFRKNTFVIGQNNRIISENEMNRVSVFRPGKTDLFIEP